MDCTTCGNEIPCGERYIAVDLHIERKGRIAVKVEDAEIIAAYHLGCIPKKITLA